MRDPSYLATNHDPHIAVDEFLALLEKSSTFACHVWLASSMLLSVGKIVACCRAQVAHEESVAESPALRSGGQILSASDQPVRVLP